MSVKKNFMKKVLAGLAAVSMMFSAVSCGESTSWAAKYGDQTVNAGVFTYYQMEALDEAKSIIRKEDENADVSDIKKLRSMTVEGVDIEKWVNDKAKEKLNKYIAVNSKFEELGLELDAEKEANIEYMTESGWQYGQADRLGKIGASKESYRLVVEMSYKEDVLFSHYYGEGGEKEYPKADYDKYLTENLARVKMIKLNLKDGKGDELDAAGKEEIRKMAEDYLKRANSGENMDKLIKEYNDYYDKLKEEAEKEENGEDADVTETTDTTEEPEVTTVSSDTAEEPEVTTVASADAEAAETTAVTTDSTGEPEVTTVSSQAADEAVTTAETSSQEAEITTAPADASEEPEVTTVPDENNEEPEDEDSDPYSNENLYFKGNEDDGYNPSETINNKIFNECKVGGNAVLAEDEENLVIYVISRLDVLERSDFTEGSYKEYILRKILDDEFAKFELEWVNSIDIQNNEKAFRRYDALKSAE